MSGRIAFFDIDGTITFRSSERSFIRYLIEKKIISHTHLGFSALRFVRLHPTYLRTGFKRNKMYLRGLEETVVQEHAQQCFSEQIRMAVKPSIVDEISRRKKDGFHIVLLSGSLRCLAAPMAELVQADDVICSETEIRSGRFTGEMTSLHPYGIAKRTLAEAYCTQRKSTLGNACAYANEWADRFLLKAVGEAVAVDPDEKLKRVSILNKWLII